MRVFLNVQKFEAEERRMEYEMRKAGLYMRVSIQGQNQTISTQAVALREYADRRGFQIVDEYADEGVSGGNDSRPALDRLMKDVRARRFDVVIVARFDRFARSVPHLLRALEEFEQLGVDFISLSESVDTSTPVGKMTFTVLGAVAEMDRSIFRERVLAGVGPGDPVRIIGPEAETYRGKRGVVSSIESARGVNRYAVKFQDGHTETFFGFELRHEEVSQHYP